MRLTLALAVATMLVVVGALRADGAPARLRIDPSIKFGEEAVTSSGTLLIDPPRTWEPLDAPTALRIGSRRASTTLWAGDCVGLLMSASDGEALIRALRSDFASRVHLAEMPCRCDLVRIEIAGERVLTIAPARTCTEVSQ